jgi:3-oxoacyl-[acyl-carrier-protein] synthase II
MTAPDPSGAGVASATRAALEGLAPWDLGWIKTHGTGTRLNDAAECAGLAGVFGDLLPGLPLTSLKPALGHTLGASPALEAVGTVLALEQGVIPPTLGYAEADPALPPHQVARFTRPARRNTALLLAESFGGRCVALLLSRSVLTPP